MVHDRAIVTMADQCVPFNYHASTRSSKSYKFTVTSTAVLVTLQICSFVCLLLEMCIWRSVYIVGNTTYILYIVIGNLVPFLSLLIRPIVESDVDVDFQYDEWLCVCLKM